MKVTYLLQKLVEETTYRTQRCEEVWHENDLIKKFAEFKAFIFSIGSAMDLVRVHIFYDFPPRDEKKGRSFTDLFDSGKKLSQGFESYLKEKITNQEELSGAIESIDRIRSIFFDKKYNGFCRRNLKEKNFNLWRIYTGLKHTSIIEESYITAVLTDGIIGASGDIMIELFDEKEGCSYEIHFPGEPVTPEGVKPEDFGYSSENQTLLWIRNLSEEIIHFLKAIQSFLEEEKR